LKTVLEKRLPEKGDRRKCYSELVIGYKWRKTRLKNLDARHQ